MIAPVAVAAVLVRADRALRPSGALIDPGSQRSHLLGGEPRPGGGHDDFGVESGDVSNEQALRAVARHDCRHAGIASLKCGGFEVETQSVGLPVTAVTLKAACFEYGQDIRGEINVVRGGRFGRPVRALVDPFPEHFDFSGCEAWAARRHHRLWILTGDVPDQNALGALARHDRGYSGIAATKDGFPVVETQAADPSLRSVAGIAARRKDRLDLADEIDFCTRLYGPKQKPKTRHQA